MLMFIVAICLVFVVIPFIVQLTFIGMMTVLPILFSIMYLAHHFRKRAFEKIENKMRILTCK